MKTILAMSAACLVSVVAQAEVPPPPAIPAKESPSAPPKLEPIEEPRAVPTDASAPGIKPGTVVSVKKDGETRIEEFRVKGRLYMIRVYPVVGLPYAMVDERGDGVFSRHDSRGTPGAPAQWKVLSW